MWIVFHLIDKKKEKRRRKEKRKKGNERERKGREGKGRGRDGTLTGRDTMGRDGTGRGRGENDKRHPDVCTNRNVTRRDGRKTVFTYWRVLKLLQMFKHLAVNSRAELRENRFQVLSIHRFLDERQLGIKEFRSLGARLQKQNKVI